MSQLSINRKAAFHSLGFNNRDKVVFLPRIEGTKDYLTLVEHGPSLLCGAGMVDSFAWAFVLAPEDSIEFSIEFVSLSVHRKLPAAINAYFSLERRWRNPPGPAPFQALLSRTEMLASVHEDEENIVKLYRKPQPEVPDLFGLGVREDGLVTGMAGFCR